MLDFYLIEENSLAPPDPDHLLQHVGGLELGVFANLQKKGIIGRQFSYFSDFRWNTTLINEMIDKIEESRFNHDADARQFYNILSKAKKNRNDIISYCD